MYGGAWGKIPMQMATLTLDAKTSEIRNLNPLDVRGGKYSRSWWIHGCARCPTILDLRLNSNRGITWFHLAKFYRFAHHHPCEHLDISPPICYFFSSMKVVEFGFRVVV